MSRRRFAVSLLVLVSVCALTLACSSNSPVVPSNPADGGRVLSRGEGRTCWGTWELRVDLKNGKVEAIPLRTADLHFDVVPLLKEATPQSCLKFANLLVDNSNHTLQIDISLKHPYPTLPQVAGFDVHGILFTRGDGVVLNDPELIMTGPDEPRLVNADGYTRWWNPSEFPPQSLLGYTDGKYGTSYVSGAYKLTLAGYKLFADGLGALEDLDSLNEADRAVFRAGITNTRRYLIDFGDSGSDYLIFNYAVDANWGLIPGFVPGGPPPNVPGDFPLTANCPEPFRIRIAETANTLSATSVGTSGDIDLQIDVFDWQAISPLSSVPMEVSVVQVEAPAFGGPPMIASVIPGSGDNTYSTYTASLSGSSPDKLDYLDIMVSATSSEGDYQNTLTFFQGTGPLQAFNLYRARVVDADTYTGWVLRYTRLLYPEYPNQGANPADIAVYKKQGAVRAAFADQVNPDPNGEGGHAPDSINEWQNDYTTHSTPEHYHLPLDMLSYTGLWNDINRICVSDTSTRLFFTNTNKFDELTSPDTDPLYCYLTWMSHTYLGNAPAAAWQYVFFSDGSYPRMWATDPSNGVNSGTDYVYSVWLYDITGIAGGDPGTDPQRYVCFRWAPPYDATTASADWVRPNNVPPNGEGTGFVDRQNPAGNRLAVDDQPARDRFYILDSTNEIEVVDCDFSMDEFTGFWPIGTVTDTNKPEDVIKIVDIECVQTTAFGAPRNYVAALCVTTTPNVWRLWVFDYDQTQPIDQQAVTIWISPSYLGIPLALDCVESPIEVHVLHQNGGMSYVTVLRDYP